MIPRRPGRPAHPVTREHLLKVASEAFSQHGYAGASMGDIAERSGIRKSSLFHHFATKDDLYREALSVVITDLGAHVNATLGGDDPFLLRMDRGTTAVQQYFGEHPVSARLLMRESVDGGTNFAVAGEAVDLLMQAGVAFLVDGMQQGAIPHQEPKQLFMSIIGVHFLYFATPEVSSRFIGTDVFAADQVTARARAVCTHVRRLVGAAVEG